MTAEASGRERVAAHWGDLAATERLAEIHWMASPVVRAHLNRRSSGDVTVDWLSWSWKRFVHGCDLRVLVLGCGEGWLERALAARPEIASIDACDVAAGAVAQAAEQARAAGLCERIRYHVVDLDADPLPGGPWDVVVAHSVLHHVRELEHCYAEIERRLVPDGLLLVNEYAGPRRFQFTEEQMRAINGCLIRLPERLRTSAVTGGVYPIREVPDEATLIATDPSEAVRSDEVMPLLAERFELLAERDLGGTLLHLLLYDVVQCFDPADPRENRVMALLCLLEESLIEAGALPSDFRMAVARNRRPENAMTSRDGLAAAGLLSETLGRGSGHRREPSPEALPAVVVHALWREPGVRAASTRTDLDRAGSAGAAVATPGAERLRIHSRPLRDRRHGLDLAPVRDAIHTRASGWPGADWTTQTLAAHPPPCGPGPTLAIDTPGGWLAERLAGEPAVEELELLVPIEHGGRLRFAWHGDPDRPPPAAHFARAFTNGWLGRAPDRPALIALLAGAIRPGGLLIGDEYIGPEDGRTTVAALRHARALLDLLQPPEAPPPDRLARLRDRLIELEHALRERFGPPRRPLEALLAPGFRLLEHRPQLGTLLQRVLAVAEPLLDPEDDRDAAWLRLVCYYEEALTEAGAIPSEYACFVARRG